MATQTISSLPLYAATDLSDGAQAFSPLDDLTVVSIDKTKRMSWTEQAKWFGGNLPKLNVSAGTLTASTPFTLSQTWNNVAVSFRGVKIAVTDTASAATSLPLEVLGGAGGVTNLLSARTDGVVQAGTEMRSPVFATRSDSGEYRLGASDDLSLVRVAADHLGLRRGATAQALSVFNTYTSGSVYERGRIGWSANVLQIGTEHIGGTARSLHLQTDGTTRISIAPTGETSVLGDLITGTNVINYADGVIRWNGRTFMACSADGLLRLSSSSGSDFTRLQFGGTTSSFPAIKRSTTTLVARLADDSANCDLTMRNVIAQDGYSEMIEMTAPSAPAANQVRIYAEDNGAGKTRLMAIFSSGAAQQIAIQP